MNERIAKFAEQAGNIVVEDKWNGDYIDFNKEKFAELIIRECAQIADDGYGSDHFGNGIAGYQLLKHFGVEE